MLFQLLVFVVSSTVSPSFADESYTIHRFESHKNKALIALRGANEKVHIGDEFFVETPVGNCYLVTESVVNDFFTVNTEQCGREFLADGKAVFPKEKVIIEHQTVTQTIEPVPTDSISVPLDFIDQEFFENYMHNRLSVFVSYLTGRNLDGRANLDSQTSVGDFKGSNTIGIGADYKIMELVSNFSWSAGFNYNLPRSYGSYVVTTTGAQQNVSFGDSPSLEVLSVYTNARYQFNADLFAQFGINYIYADASGLAGDMSGDFGFHGGLRYYAYKNLFVDGQINFYNLDYNLAGTTYDFSLTELELKAGYTF
jgi:hypothetical protein